MIGTKKPLRQFIACAVMGCAALTQPAHSETLAEIYQQALANDHTYQAAKAALEAGREADNQGMARLLPNVSAQGSWSDSETTDSGESVRMVPSAPTVVEDVDGNHEVTLNPSTPTLTTGSQTSEATSTGYSVTLSQTLFDLSAWHRYQQGKAAVRIAEAQYAVAEQELILRVAEAYFNALEAVDVFETARAEEEALQHQLEQTKQRFEVGLTAITEVHEAQAAYDSSTASRLAAEGRLGIAFEALEVITGRPYNKLNPLSEDFPVNKPEPAARNEWVDFAMENNLSLLVASLRSESAEQSYKASRSQLLPSLSASASYSSTDTTTPTGAFGDVTGTREQQSIGVTLSVPIFAGGSNWSGKRQASAEAWQAREQFNQTRRDVVQRTRSSHLEVITGVATVQARQQAITSSESALRATQAGYEVGTRDLVDVLNAQRNLFRARRDYYTALYDYVIGTLRLKQVAGTLNPQDVADLSQWLDESQTVSSNPQAL